MMPWKRICADILLFFSVLFMPWWSVLLFSVLLIFFFESFYEALLAGFLFDVLYSAPSSGFFGFQYVFTLFSFILFFLCAKLKKRIVFYPSKF